MLLLALVLGMCFRLAAQSTQVVITMNDGSEQTFFLTESDRVYFENNEKLVIEISDNAKTLTKIALADIRKMTCGETVGTNENDESLVAVFPNPVHDVMTLRHLSGTQTISIYAIDGRLMRTMTVSGDQAIDVSDFPAGLYLVKTQYNTLKMFKL